MSRELTSREYWDEIDSIVENVKEEIREYGGDVYNHVSEAVDGHQWIIYREYNDDVLKHSDHKEEGIDQGLVDANKAIKNGGLSNFKTQLAYCAMQADVLEKMDN